MHCGLGRSGEPKSCSHRRKFCRDWRKELRGEEEALQLSPGQNQGGRMAVLMLEVARARCSWARGRGRCTDGWAPLCQETLIAA